MTQFSELHDVWSKRWTQLSSFRALVFLLLTQSCAGRVQVVGPSQPVVAMVGNDVVLTCQLEPAVDASDMSVVWSREDLDPRNVFVRWDGVELNTSQHLSYKGRTSLLVSKLELGDVSLKLSKVKLSDEGKYRCFIPTLDQGSTVELVVGTDPSAVISLAGLGRTSSSVELQCKSAGWYPQPEVLWLDGEGKLLSAGPTETVRGPDDLYTVSSRVTVEKRHSNKFTCRVQQNNIHQTREALIQVTDDFFKVQSSYTSTIVGLAVSLALSIIILLILAVVLLVRTRRQNRKMKTLVNEKQQERKRINNQLNQEKQNNETLKSRLDELEKKWMENVGTLNTELQNMKQELVPKGPITLEEVHHYGFYIRLKNISTEEIQLKGWRLELQVNNEQAIYRFKKSLKLQSGGILSLRRPGCSSKQPYDVELEWSYLKNWRPEDQLPINLISNNGEIYKLL